MVCNEWCKHNTLPLKRSLSLSKRKKRKKELAMNTLLPKNVKSLFPLKDHPFLQVPRRRSRRGTISCKSDDNSSRSKEGGGASEADARRQEILAKIAMLQTQKVRLTDFLDERSAYLTQFAQDADAEFDQIGETALKGLEEAEARILENIENRMQAFEENAESTRNDIEKNEQVVAEFEDEIDLGRNEGLFFKNLSTQKMKPSSGRAYAPQEEMQKLRQVSRANAGSKARRSIYLALICLLALTILNALITSPAVDWRKIAALAVILVALIAQFTYEQRMSSAAAPGKAVEDEEQQGDQQ